MKHGNIFASEIVYSKPISTEGDLVLSRMNVEELNALMRREFPQSNSLLEEVSGGRVRVRIPVDHNLLRLVGHRFLTDDDVPCGHIHVLRPAR